MNVAQPLLSVEMTPYAPLQPEISQRLNAYELAGRFDFAQPLDGSLKVTDFALLDLIAHLIVAYYRAEYGIDRLKGGGQCRRNIEELDFTRRTVTLTNKKGKCAGRRF